MIKNIYFWTGWKISSTYGSHIRIEDGMIWIDGRGYSLSGVDKLDIRS